MTKTLQPLKDKIALVVGGSRGIGAGIVRRLAEDGAGIALTYAAAADKANELVQQIAAGGVRAIAIKADSGNEAELRDAVAKTKKQFGRLDILVVNAGVLIRGGILEYRMEDLDRMLAVNVRGVVVAIQAAAAHMGQGGRVITIGSNTAVRTGFPGASIYSMTKGAIASLVRGVAIDLAPRGITVNNVQPGPTVTDMTSVPGMAEAVKPLIPLGRMGSTAEIAAMVAYLVGPESGFVTGASMTIDGGYVA
jgi:3-oxoacyl-[acyl-carrier protein] reductase